MESENYVLPRAVTISAEAADKLLERADGAAALLYIYILKNGGKLDLKKAAEKLKMGSDINAAWNSLRSMGLVEGAAAKNPGKEEKENGEEPENRKKLKREDTVPEYSSADVKALTEGNPEFSALVHEVQEILGNVLSSNALIELAGFYDYLGLPADVILMLIVSCTEEYEKKNGAGKKPSLRSIRREAYKWADMGIDSLEAAGGYIKKTELVKKRKTEIRRLLGIQERAPSPTEEKYITGWAEAEYSDELISAAYDKTVINTGKLAWSYLNSILTSWEQKGLKSLEEVRSGDSKGNKKENSAQTANSSGEAELAEMKEYLEKLRKS